MTKLDRDGGDMTEPSCTKSAWEHTRAIIERYMPTVHPGDESEVTDEECREMADEALREVVLDLWFQYGIDPDRIGFVDWFVREYGDDDD